MWRSWEIRREWEHWKPYQRFGKVGWVTIDVVWMAPKLMRRIRTARFWISCSSPWAPSMHHMSISFCRIDLVLVWPEWGTFENEQVYRPSQYLILAPLDGVLEWWAQYAWHTAEYRYEHCWRVTQQDCSGNGNHANGQSPYGEKNVCARLEGIGEGFNSNGSFDDRDGKLDVKFPIISIST